MQTNEEQNSSIATHEQVGRLRIDLRRRDGKTLSAPVPVQLVSVEADLLNTIQRGAALLRAAARSADTATGAPVAADLPTSLPAPFRPVAPPSTPLTFDAEIDPATGQASFPAVPDGEYRLVLTLPDDETRLRAYCTQGMELDIKLALDADSLFDMSYVVPIRAGIESRVEVVLEPPYETIQFVGYLIPTGDRIGPSVSDKTNAQASTATPPSQAEPATVTHRRPGIRGVAAKLKKVVTTAVAEFQDDATAREDLLQRCKIMKAAIRQAYDTVHTPSGEDESVLKVFMAPEFYFQGSESGYPVRFMALLVAEMQEELNQEKYRNWLFVLGTIVVYREKLGSNVNVFNCAPVWKGGPSLPLATDKWAGLKQCTVIKSYVAHRDFKSEGKKTDTVLPISIGSKPQQLNVKGSKNAIYLNGKTYSLHDWFSKPGGEWCIGGKNGGSHFKIDSIVFGLEVCLDHSLERIVKYQASPVITNEEPKAQVQLIPSAGMHIQSFARACDLIWNVDHEHCVVQSNTTGTWPSYPEEVSPVSALKVAAIANPRVEAFETFFKTKDTLDAPAGTDPSLLIQPGSTQLISSYGYLVVYSPQAIPSPKFVSG